MAVSNRFRNLVCMADLFFALSASLFLLSAQENKTLAGEQPLLDRKPDVAAMVEEVSRQEAEAARLARELATIESDLNELDPPSAAPNDHE